MFNAEGEGEKNIDFAVRMDNFLGKYNNLFSTKTIKHCLY
jgi:hypothetical protein